MKVKFAPSVLALFFFATGTLSAFADDVFQTEAFPTVQLEDGRAAVLAEVVAVHADGTVEARPISDANADESTDGSGHSSRSTFFEAAAVVPAVGYSGLTGFTGQIAFVVGKRAGGHLGGVEGVMIGGSYGTTGMEFVAGYALASVLGAATYFSYVHLNQPYEGKSSLYGLGLSLNILLLQIKTGLYIDGSRVVPTAGIGLALPLFGE